MNIESVVIPRVLAFSEHVLVSVPHFSVSHDATDFWVGVESLHEFLDGIFFNYAVGIYQDQISSLGSIESSCHCRPLSPVLLMYDVELGMDCPKVIQDFLRAIFASIVHCNNLQVLVGGAEDRTYDLLDQGYLVVYRYYHRN